MEMEPSLGGVLNFGDCDVEVVQSMNDDDDDDDDD
jgi:hypothetical protein